MVRGELGIRFYAGAPLVNEEGIVLGTLCVFDHVPRTLTEQQQQALRVLARHVMTHLELRRHTRNRSRARPGSGCWRKILLTCFGSLRPILEEYTTSAQDMNASGAGR